MLYLLNIIRCPKIFNGSDFSVKLTLNIVIFEPRFSNKQALLNIENQISNIFETDKNIAAKLLLHQQIPPSSSPSQFSIL